MGDLRTARYNPGMPESIDLPARMIGAVLLGPESIEIREVDVPRPDVGELILRVGAATTCGTDVKVFRRGGHPRMLRVPTLFGHEMAGEVAAIGPSVESFSAGDRVVVANSAACGECQPCRAHRENLCLDLQYLNGAFAEYLRVPARFVKKNTLPIPASLAFEKAALTEPLACVLHGVEACNFSTLDALDPESRTVVVYGGGPIGLLFVAVIARRGYSVLLADPNPSRLEAGRRLGAKKLLQVQRGGQQAETIQAELPEGQGAPLVIEATGVPEVWEDAVGLVRPGGEVMLFGGCAPGTSVPLDTHLLHYSEITLKGVYHHRPENVRQAVALLAEPDFNVDVLLSATTNVAGVEEALRSMMRKEALKVVVKP
jgi:L-iditol 2-dehydrogenase